MDSKIRVKKVDDYVADAKAAIDATLESPDKKKLAIAGAVAGGVVGMAVIAVFPPAALIVGPWTGAVIGAGLTVAANERASDSEVSRMRWETVNPAVGGAAMGAAAGSVFPGVGTALGAVVGGVVGALSGAASETVRDMAGMAVGATGDTVRDMAGGAKEALAGISERLSGRDRRQVAQAPGAKPGM